MALARVKTINDLYKEWIENPAIKLSFPGYLELCRDQGVIVSDIRSASAKLKGECAKWKGIMLK